MADARMDLKLGFVSLARPAFDFAYAQGAANTAWTNLKKEVKEVVVPAELLISDEPEALAVASHFKSMGIDALLIQCGTFASANLALLLTRELDVPVLIWALREPEWDGTLRLNSLVCANAITSSLYKLGRQFKFFYQDADDPQFYASLKRYLNVIRTVKTIKTSRLGLIGNRPVGFQDVSVDELSFMKKFGTDLHIVSIAEVLAKANSYDEEKLHPVLKRLQGMGKALHVNDANFLKMARLYQALRDLVEEYRIDALAVQCLPDFAEIYGVSICGCLSALIDDGIIAACEGDLLGAMTMYAQKLLSNGQAPFLADFISNEDPENNIGLLWHCGVAPCSLAVDPSAITLEPHYVRKKGFTVNFSLKSGPVNMARFDSVGADFRLLSVGGECTGETTHLNGTSMQVKFDVSITKLLDSIIYNGFPHHFSLVYQDLQDEMLDLSRLLEIDFYTV